MDFNKYGIKTSVDTYKFIVNEKKGCVTCVLEYRLTGTDLAVDVMSVLDDKFYNKNFVRTAVGVARLNNEDTFDVEIGKKVARAKAESMMYNMAGQYINALLVKLQRDFMDPCIGFLAKAGNTIDHNDEYLKQF